MNSVGIDLHRKRSFVAVIDDCGELTTSRRIVNDRDAFLELLGGLEGEPDRGRGDLRLGVARRVA